MKSIVHICIILLLASCSSLKKTLIYSSLLGGLSGASGGALLSPNKESRGANTIVFGVVGAGVATLAGYALYEDDPRNYKLKNMLRPGKEVDSNNLAIGIGSIQIDANFEKKEGYQVPLKSLPEKLKGKVNKQYLIKHESKERYLKKGQKTFYIPSFEIFEHAYDDKVSERLNE